MIDGFGERTRGVAQLMRDPRRAFLIVTSPEPEPARGGGVPGRASGRAGHAAGRLIVNRMHLDGLGDHTTEQVGALLGKQLGESLASRVARNLADFDVFVQRDRATVARLSAPLHDAPADPRPASR